MTIADLNMDDVCCVTYTAPHRLVPHSNYVGTVVRLGKAGGGPISPGYSSDSDDHYITIRLNDDTHRTLSQSKVINISLWE
jgi:hypothetical protein